jgi:ubiquinone/menaquinone biosynthesis C-methylase UbiE
MNNDPLFEELLLEFSKFYWLKPADIIWDTVPAYYIRKFIEKNDKVLDLGCGDGLFAAITLGAKLPSEYDRFISAKPNHQRIGEEQSGDIYSDPKVATHLIKNPVRSIDVGLELKPHHLKVAESLGIYEQLIEGNFEDIPCENGSFDKVFSSMAFYWGDNLNLQLQEVHRVLKDSGEFLVTLISEHSKDIHWAKSISEGSEVSPPMKDYLEELDGGRRDFITKNAGSTEEWEALFKKEGFKITKTVPIINEMMFFLQDIAQRPFLKIFLKMAESKKFQPFRAQVKEYLCEEVYPELLGEIQKYEGNKDVRHHMYLFVATKV